MENSFQDLLKRLDHLSDQFRELKDGVQKAVLVADLDPEMALTRARKVLEYVIRDVYERRISEPPGTRPLENLLQRLVKDGFFPDRLDAYASTVRKLGNVGTHTFGEKVTATDVFQSLTQLMPILEWYFENERPEAVAQHRAQQPEIAMAGRAASPRAAQPENRLAIVPKGLRSFDAKDADFFLDLLPGARDKDGLPESIRFWKHRIETPDDVTFTVGVIYGPSGCGKSSLVKAGLLPRLANQVLSVYVEATAADTEARLLKGLRKRCPGLAADLDLTGTIAALHQGRGLSKGQKVLIVLDQFEQWLHAQQGKEETNLVQALRQCDGEHVQCVVMVRDDFWLAVSRFMTDLHIELVQGQNLVLVDLFDLIHARTVLSAFGRAFGRLHENFTRDQEAFLDQAVAGLAQNGRVICVRLALFAEMMKGKPWTPASLKAVGGTAGVGVTFLEETFSAATAPPDHRYHQNAARAVLKSLLPESGTDIKGHMRSQAELMEASGYVNRPKDFDDLLRILDSEIRLLTPTDPDGALSEPEASARVKRVKWPLANAANASGSDKYYQLTHDYLVHSLRDWLTRKQKETRRGRVELLLADRAVVWNSRPENRQLPSLLQWFQIKCLTQKKNWTPPQRTMMRKAGRCHAVRGFVVAMLIAAFSFTGLTIREHVVQQQKATEAVGLVQRLLDANIAEVPGIVSEIESYRTWADPLLGDAYAQAEKAKQASRQLHASLALLPVDSTQVEYLSGRLLDSAPSEVPVIRDALARNKDALLDKLWEVAESPSKGKEYQRLRAAATLATYDPESERWVKASGPVVDQLVAENPVFLGLWMEGFRPIKGKLLESLKSIYRNPNARESERTLATNILADYAADQLQVLADLLIDADERQFAVIYPKFKEHGERGLPMLTGEIAKKLPSDIPSSDDSREKLAKRQANAAVALLRMSQPEKVWPLLKHSPDPRVRSYLIHRLAPLGADARVIIKQMDEEPDMTIRRALILSLGAYGEHVLAQEDTKAVLAKVQELYRTEADPGLHAATEWLLGTWKQTPWLRQVNNEWAKNKEQREKQLEGFRHTLAKEIEKTPKWYVNSQGQTMVVIPAPVEFMMGSPSTEPGREDSELLHKQQIANGFALASKPVSLEQFIRFRKNYKYIDKLAPTDDCPAHGVTWYEAAEYCNWLSSMDGLSHAEWCYNVNNDGKYEQGMKIVPTYATRKGYRLPTEAEWEFACRAGARTCRYFGEQEELLEKYGWFSVCSGNRSHPIGTVKPNDFGLFDMHGNVWTWCQDMYLTNQLPKGGAPSIDYQNEFYVSDKVNRSWRGGAFNYPAGYLRCGLRDGAPPTTSYLNVGFRVARTFTP